MIISALIAGTAAEGLTKAGPGVLSLADNDTYTGVTTISQGTLLADAPSGTTVGPISLSGGTLGGIGTVGTVTSATAGGTVQPADSNASTGALTSGNETWNKLTTFFVVLNSAAAGQYDQLLVNGNINLSGALLAGLSGPGVNFGDQFTVIQTTGGTVSGSFTTPFGPNTVFIGGDKYTVSYSNPTQVVLTRAKNNATIAVTSSANPSVYGQDVTLTATLSPQLGAGAIPSTDTVTFTVDSVVYPPVNVTNNQAVLDAGQLLSVGTHTVVVSFSGDPNDFNPVSNTTSPFTQTVGEAATTVTLSALPSPLIVGQPANITATIAPVAPGSGVPTGSVTFTVDGVVQTTSVPLNGSGQATLVLPGLTGGQHTFSASYPGDGNFSATKSTKNFVVNVVQATPAITIGVPSSSTVYGQPATFTITVATNPSGPITPTGSVTFTSGTFVKTATLAAGVATIAVSTLPLGTDSISVSYTGDTSVLSGSATTTFKVSQANSTTTVTSSANPVANGVAVIFTATVTGSSPSTLNPSTGQVTFVIDGTTKPATTVTSAGVATLTLVLSSGQHTATANYGGNTDFAASTGNTVNQIVGNGTNTVVSASPGTVVVGQPTTLTATVTPQSGIGTATGSVVFVINGVAQTQQYTLSGGSATESYPFPHVGSYTVSANYLGSSSLSASSAATAASVKVNMASTTTTLVSSGLSSVYGQPVTFTATVQGVSPSTGYPTTGSVTFVVDGTSEPAVAVSAAGVATLTIPSSSLPTALTATTHSISASFTATADYGGSSAAKALSQSVSNASTATVVTSSAAAIGPNQPVTFTATVSAVSPSVAVPGVGTVTFSIDGVNQTPIALSSAGKAALVVSNLTGGSHSIIATYNAGANFNGSVSTPAFIETVLKGSVITVSQPASLVYGQTATFTATVSAALAGSGTPTGSVSFVIDGVTKPAVAINSSGVATVTVSGLTAGSHTVGANYLGDSNFAPISTTTTVTQTITKATSSVTISSSAPNSSVGQAVTFTATVKPNSPATTTPTGTVTFVIDGVAQPPVAVNAAGVATLTTTTLTAGKHSVTVAYNGDGNFTGSSPAAALTQTVQAAVASLSAVASGGGREGVGSPFSITVTALTSTGTTDTTYSGTATITVESSSSLGVVGGNLTATFVNGVATFTGLTISKAGTYVLEITTGNVETTITISSTGRQT